MKICIQSGWERVSCWVAALSYDLLLNIPGEKIFWVREVFRIWCDLEHRWWREKNAIEVNGSLNGYIFNFTSCNVMQCDVRFFVNWSYFCYKSINFFSITILFMPLYFMQYIVLWHARSYHFIMNFICCWFIQIHLLIKNFLPLLNSSKLSKIILPLERETRGKVFVHFVGKVDGSSSTSSTLRTRTHIT